MEDAVREATEVFAELSLFEGIVTESNETGDCSCFDGGGQPGGGGK